MKVSIIIATCDRPAELRDALQSILKQTRLPAETVIVDDSSDSSTRNTVAEMRDFFSENGIALRYIGNGREKSLTVARNMGVEVASGELILFLDDDVVLDRRYVEQLLKVYQKYPTAMGVQGAVTRVGVDGKKPRLINFLKRTFFLPSHEENSCRVLPSGNGTYPYPLTRMINCQWLSGSNQSYRCEVFKTFRFDEKLRRWAFTEDIDFSYRIYKRYPNSLFATPEAQFSHKAAKTARLESRTVRYMRTIYRSYFFYKNIRQTPYMRACYFISVVFDVFSEILLSRGRSTGIAVSSYAYMLRNLWRIRRGDFRFFEEVLRG